MRLQYSALAIRHAYGFQPPRVTLSRAAHAEIEMIPRVNRIAMIREQLDLADMRYFELRSQHATTLRASAGDFDMATLRELVNYTTGTGRQENSSREKILAAMQSLTEQFSKPNHEEPK